jgi:hypothetical protein
MWILQHPLFGGYELKFFRFERDGGDFYFDWGGWILAISSISFFIIGAWVLK